MKLTAIFLIFCLCLLFSGEAAAARRKKRAPAKRAPLSTPIPPPQTEPEPAPETTAAAPEPQSPEESPTISFVSSPNRRIGRRGWLILPSFGVSKYGYFETARADFTSIGLVAGIFAQGTSRKGWLGGAELEATLTTVSKTDAKRPTGFARLAGFGGRTIFVDDWDLTLKVGLQARSMFTEGTSYGYPTLNGVFLSPGIGYHFSSRNFLRVQGRLMHAFVSPVSLSNRELGVELNWIVGLSRKTYLLMMLGYSHHTFAMGNTTVRASDTYVRLGLAF